MIFEFITKLDYKIKVLRSFYRLCREEEINASGSDDNASDVMQTTKPRPMGDTTDTTEPETEGYGESTQDTDEMADKEKNRHETLKYNSEKHSNRKEYIDTVSELQKDKPWPTWTNVKRRNMRKTNWKAKPSSWPKNNSSLKSRTSKRRDCLKTSPN